MMSVIEWWMKTVKGLKDLPCEELETLYVLSYKLPNVLKDAIEVEIAERTTRRE
ncbi:MAG: hypothetical protein M3299_10220 [Thermoproteota archaeon]|nr:hypothetical protein [Thermoproteota archaeon]